MKRLLTFTAAILIVQFANALTFPIAPDDDLVGHIDYVHAQVGDTLSSLCQQYDMGYYEMIEANPSIYRHSAIPPTDNIVIPSYYILPPDVPHEGIVVNLPELRLYYFLPGENTVVTYPLAIGRYEWITPTIVTKVIEKQPNP